MEEIINKSEQSLRMQLAQLKDAFKNSLNELESIDNICSTHGIPKREAVYESEPGIKAVIKTYGRVKLLIKMLEEKVK